MKTLQKLSLTFLISVTIQFKVIISAKVDLFDFNNSYLKTHENSQITIVEKTQLQYVRKEVIYKFPSILKRFGNKERKLNKIFINDKVFICVNNHEFRFNIEDCVSYFLNKRNRSKMLILFGSYKDYYNFNTFLTKISNNDKIFIDNSIVSLVFIEDLINVNAILDESHAYLTIKKDYYLQLYEYATLVLSSENIISNKLPSNLSYDADMYKNHDLWEDALRVAKSYGPSNEVNRKVLDWVKDWPVDQQRKKLLSVGMIDALIDIEIQNDNFEEAFKLAEAHSKYKLPEIHMKYAMKLEDEKRYHDAEEHYIKADQIMEVIKMYEHILDFNAALRVARQHLPDMICPIYISHGNHLLEKGDFQKAEMCFVNGKKPDLMVKFYIDKKMLDEALKFARKHCQQFVEIIINMLDITVKPVNDMTGPEIIKEVENKLNDFRYSNAIELLLGLTTSHFNSIEKLSEYWEKAINIAMEHERSKASDVVLLVADKLKDVGLFGVSAVKYESIGQIEDAVACYLEDNNFDRAKKLIVTIKPGTLRQKLEKMLKDKDSSHGGSNDVIDVEGLEMILERGEYDKVITLALKHSDEMFNKYLKKIVEKYLLHKNYIGAAEFLERYETPIYKYNLELYKELAEEILAEENVDELRALKDMLFCCLKHLVNHQEFTTEMKYLARLHKISYYQHIKAVMKANPNDYKFSYYYACMTILSYGDIVKFDLALLDAGMEARNKNLKGVAFILLNRYVDLYEIIQDPSVKLDWAQEFDETEMPQKDPFKSETNILTPDEKDKLQTWIVKTSVDKSVEFKLPKKDCPKCKKKIFEFNTVCMSCSYTYDQCVVTGYPINTQSETISCSNCSKKALKEAWKEWISIKEKCPWCNSIQISYK